MRLYWSDFGSKMIEKNQGHAIFGAKQRNKGAIVQNDQLKNVFLSFTTKVCSLTSVNVEEWPISFPPEP